MVDTTSATDALRSDMQPQSTDGMLAACGFVYLIERKKLLAMFFQHMQHVEASVMKEPVSKKLREDTVYWQH